MKKTACIIFLCYLFLNPSIATAGVLKVFVSILPQKYFVKQIGKDLVDVKAMVKPGANPSIYEPKPSQMAALSKTAVYFSIGVPFERTWMKKIKAANPGLRVVETDKGVKKLAMLDHDHDDGHNHARKPDHGGVHTGLDPHIWLSPDLVKHQAAIILNSLIKVLPEHRNVLTENYNRFILEIDRVDRDIRSLLKGRQGTEFMVFHPSWGYFAQEYQLKQIPIETQGKSPKPDQVKSLIQHARKKGIRIIFAQPQFSSKSANLIAKAIKGKVVFADSLAEDWSENMRTVSEQFMEALK